VIAKNDNWSEKMAIFKNSTLNKVSKALAVASATIIFSSCSQSDGLNDNTSGAKEASEKVKAIAQVDAAESKVMFDVFGDGSQAVFSARNESTVSVQASGSVLSSKTNMANFTSKPYSANSVQVQKSVEEQVNGKRVEISLNVKASSAGGDQKFGVIYFTLGSGNSGIRRFTPTQDFKDYTFEYLIPETGNAPNFDVISILSDLSGQGRAIEISSIKMTVVN